MGEITRFERQLYSIVHTLPPGGVIFFMKKGLMFRGASVYIISIPERVIFVSDYIEEITPKGISVKLLPEKWRFLAFSQDGASIYADEHNLEVLHRVPVIVFLGERFRIENNYNQELFLSMLKVSRGKLVVPYVDARNDRRQFLFLSISESVDLIPARIFHKKDIYVLVREVGGDFMPDYVIINRQFTKNDVIVITNRCPAAKIVLEEDNISGMADNASPQEAAGDEPSPEKEVNLNVLSENPVFLAKVHLRKPDIVKVKQLLLDFDLDAIETDYIISFIEDLLKKSETDSRLEKQKDRLISLRDSFRLYLHLLNRDSDSIAAMLQNVTDKSDLATFNTLIAKIKMVYTDKEDQLLFTSLENMVWEMREKLQSST